MPLSPISKTERKAPPPDPNDKMPIVLPMAPPPTKPAAPVRLLPAQTTCEVRTVPSITSEANQKEIEQNLRRFLRDTRNLEWENVTVIELKRILRQYELNATGKKADLMQRIEKIRRTYQHLELEEIKMAELPQMEKSRDSSPETMGSDSGTNSTVIKADIKDSKVTSEGIESLFADGLNIPTGQDLLFS